MVPDSSEEEQKAKGKKGKKGKKVAVKKEAKEPTLEGVLVTAARSEEHTSNSSHSGESRMPSSA